MAGARRAGMMVPGAFALLGLVVLLGLGTWQLERKAWKEALIETLARRLSEAPIALPPSYEWSGMTQANSEFVRVRLRVEYFGDDALLYTSGAALRDDVKAPGYFVFTPALLPDGSRIVVNRGYSAEPQAERPSGSREIVGALRWPEGSPLFIADHDAAARVWYARDQRAMAQARNWGSVAPFYVEQEAPVPAGGRPHPAALTVRLRNDHLQYALTWYALAAVLVVMFALWAGKRRRESGAANPVAE